MHVSRFLSTIVFLLTLGLAPAMAQDDDKGFLTNAIQNALSGSGRTVSIDGFRGALSSQASFDQMTIADDEGIWLTLTDVVLDWNRSALLRGRLEVESLTAQRLDLPRLPVSQGNDLPEAEAQPFSLPDLPVSIEIADFGVEEINLGAPILGEEAQLSVTADARLTDDVARLAFLAQRTDDKRGVFEISADYQRSEGILDLLLKLEEEEEGIAARLLNIPDQPSVSLTVEGSGPVDALETQVVIATDDTERLAGQIVLGTQTPRRASDTPDRRIQADIGGDITALLAPRYREFFGEDVKLTIDALLEGNGAIEVSSFALDTQAAKLAGRVNLNQEKWPTFIDIEGVVENADGTRVLLPVSGEATTVQRVGLDVNYDAADGEAFDGRFDIQALETTGVKIEDTELELVGTLQGELGSVGQFLGDLSFATQGMEFTDPAVSEAVGSAISGAAKINYIEGSPLRISGLDLSGADYGLTGQAVVNGFDQGFLTRLDATLKASNLSRFSALAGQDLNGQTALALKGTVTPLSGMFDLAVAGSTQDLSLGIEQADAVLGGRTELSLQARRNETGTYLRDLVLENEAINLSGAVELRSNDSRANVSFRLDDIARVAPQYSGAVAATVDATQDARGWTVAADVEGPYESRITVNGLATGPDALLTFAADVPDMQPFVPQATGPLEADGTLRQTEDGFRLETVIDGPDDIRASVEGLVTPKLDIAFDLAVPRLAPYVPQIAEGGLNASGTVTQTQEGIAVDVTADGPYDLRAMVEGIATGPRLSLDFDVRLPDVQPLVPSVEGPLSLQGNLSQGETGLVVDMDAAGPYDSTATVEGTVTGPDLAVTFDVAMPDLQPLVPNVSGPLTAAGSVRQAEGGLAVSVKAEGPEEARAMVEGIATGPNMALEFDVSIPDIQPFVPSVEGAVNATGDIRQTAKGLAVEVDATGPYGVRATASGVADGEGNPIEFELAVPQVEQFVPSVRGALLAEGTLHQTPQGFVIDTRASGPYGARAMVEGLATGPDMSLEFALTVPDVKPFVPQLSGALEATGTVAQSPEGIVVDTELSGPYGAQASVSGLATGPDMNLAFDVSVPNLNPLVPQVNGPLNASGTVRQTPRGIVVDTVANGPYGARAAVEGVATGPNMSLTFDVSVPNVQPLVPQVNGPLNATGTLRQTPAGIAVDTNVSGPYSSRASIEGVVTGPSAAVSFDVSLPNVGVFVDEISGPLSVNGTARRQGEAWRIDTDATGPSGTQARIAGLVNPDGTLALDIDGSAPLGLANPFIEPRSLQGLARFDLSLNGPPELGSLSGTIETSDASLTAPNLRIALEGIAGSVRLGNNRAQIDLSARGSEGGQLRIGGGITLTGSLPADIQIGLQNIVLIDPRLYRTSLSGQLRIAGPLTGGAAITGQVNVGETNITVPSTGLTSIGEIPSITHLNDRRAAEITRAKAGLNEDEAGGAGAEADDTAGPGLRLDVLVSAPNRIFVRGRGLDAELGGSLRLTGTTNRIISSGRFDLIRGRLDILGKRFNLREGSIQFQGDFVPFIRFVTATDTATGEVRIIVEGPANEPQVRFESTPDAPQDEVLAQLLFGRNITEISAFQALQLANAVATLAGRGGTGVISNLREGFGLDDLDITTTDDGATALRAGKYISENVYTDVTAASDGTGEVSLNLDLTPNLTARGTLGSDGDSRLGIFYEKDY